MKTDKPYDSLVILGPTASGKTKLAVTLAGHLNGEILSADSRMVYKNMDIGTGKDLSEYFYLGQPVKYHMINLVEPEEFYHLYRFQQDFKTAFALVQSNGKLPVICGGSGLYLDAVINDYKFTSIPVNLEIRKKFEETEHSELKQIFESLTVLQNKFNADLSTKKRTIRAIEIQHFLSQNPNFEPRLSNPINPFVIGINPPLDLRRKNISKRLKIRMEQGLIEEVESLMKTGLSMERLAYFGLEYKWVSLYLSGNINKVEMTEKLETAIQQFAKRQMTYFRKMEKGNLMINWVDSIHEARELIPKSLQNSIS